MSKLMNIVIGLVIIGILAGGGYLGYLYIRPPETKSALDLDLESWQQKVDQNPGNALYRANLGVTLIQKGQFGKAIQELQAALNIEPGAFTYQDSLGDAYRLDGQPDKALDQYKQALAKFPQGNKYSTAYKIADILFNDKHDLNGAANYVQQSIADNGNIWNSLYLYGQILERQGKLAQAKQEYEKAAEFNGSDPGVQAALKRVEASKA